ncbi:MAG: HAMP domain-containing protein, partial [Spirochaetales bacterium]|nr:HAMP domain-containing protein [Spirochaetales bacterium]
MSSNQNKTSSLIIHLISFIGIGFAILTFIQVVTLSELAKSYSRKENVNSYVRWIDSVNAHLAQIIEGFYKDLQVYVGADIIESGDIKAVGEWLTKNTNLRTKEYDYIMAAGADGLAYTDIGKQTSIADRDYFQAIMQKGQKRFIDNPVESKTTGDKVVHIATGLYDADGKLFGMIAGVIKTEVLAKPIKELNVPKGVWPFLCDGNGFIIYHPAAIEGASMLIPFDDAHKDLPEVAKRMLSGEKGYAWITGWTGSKQDLFVYSSVAGTPWGLGFVIPGNLIDSLGFTIRNIAILFGFIVLIMILFIGVIVLVRSLKPLKTVKDTIMGIATGNADLTKRIEINSHNEIGQVVSGFNMFAEKLQNIIRDVKTSKNELNV